MTPRQVLAQLIERGRRDLEREIGRAVDASLKPNEAAHLAHRANADIIRTTLNDLARVSEWPDHQVEAFVADVKADRRTSQLLPN